MQSRGLTCPFRFNVRRNDAIEVATCGLIQQLLETDETGICDVERDACESCAGSLPEAGRFVNTVFPSILNAACADWLAQSSRCQSTSPSARRVQDLLAVTENAIVDDQDSSNGNLASCDVYLCCSDATDATLRSINSVLHQQNANVLVHLVIDSPEAAELGSVYGSVWNVLVHRFESPTGLFRAVHDLAPAARSEFIALHHARAFSMPNRIDNSIAELRRTGSDVAGSAMQTPTGEIAAISPTDAYESLFPWPTLVFRRDWFIDLGGFADRHGDEDVELVFRGLRSRGKLHRLAFPTVQLNDQWIPAPLGPEPKYEEHLHSLRHHGIGYPHHCVQSDVVIPIYGQLQYVPAAIESIIDQDGAETIVHLIDDAGPESVDSLFDNWRSHPRIRLYRNTKNVGQYVSFNNVSEYFETDLVTVQDSDDISLPHRVNTGGNLMRLCDADFFAATMEQFGDRQIMDQIAAHERYRRSYWPYKNYFTYFAMNPTACFRTSMFRRLGGYSDFGGRQRNRGGLDSEFMIRAYFSGARFAFSSSVVSRHRIHPDAATRRAETGFGSETRTLALQECRRRLGIFRKCVVDPRAFGGLGRYQEVTQRVK
ncbi:MAG: glycosyltransferase family 2 protein [Planctomycetales bacterium]|nr:glycosyltransferase family 2 protein [Planctomycetales bacterium]